MKRIVWPVIAGLLLLAGVDGYGQEAMERVYADAETHGGLVLVVPLYTVSNPLNAVDNDLATRSSLQLTALGDVWQQLIFTGESPQPDDAVHIKMGTSTGLLSLLNGLTIQAYNGTTGVGASYSAASLIGLLNGADQNELVLPAPGVPFNGVRLTYNGAALGGGFNIYDAYFYKEIAGPIACDQPLDLLYGSSGAIAAGVNGVENPSGAIDKNDTTFATLHANLSAANKTHVTALYPTLSSPGDSIRLLIQYPGSGLLDATVLANNFTIRTYNDNLDNGPIDLNTSSLRLRLFPGTTDKQVLTYPVTQPFNRIEVSVGEGLAVALSSLNIYEVERITVGPVVTGVVDNIFATCAGAPVTLTIENPVSGQTYQWYDESGAPLETGTSFEPGVLAAGDHTYYVTTTRAGCNTESGRTMVVIRAEGPTAADIDVDTNDPICLGEDVVLSPSSTTVTDPVFKWYHDQQKTQPITEGSNGTINYQIAGNGTLTITGLVVGSYTYYVSVSNLDQCENAAGALKEVIVTVDALPAPPIITLTH